MAATRATDPVGPGKLKPSTGTILKTPGVCGGSACIRDTRITVWGLANWRHLGLSDEEILQRVAGLTREDLNAAWDYYQEHRGEIEGDIRLNEAA